MNLSSIAIALLLPSAAFAQEPQPAHRPALFQDLDFAEAKAKAAAEDKLLLLDAMTSWCGPCKVMDRTTWVDPRVVRWMQSHAVAVQLDMDIHTAVKDEVGVKAFPTMVLFRADGSEFDRVVGLRPAEEMLVWLEGARGGTREIDRVRADIAALVDGGAADVRQSMALAGQALDLDSPKDAAPLVAWLWNRAPADDAERALLRSWRAGVGKNVSKELIAALPGETAMIKNARDVRASQLKSNEDPALRREWISLNAVLDEEAATASWASILASRPEGRTALQAHGRVVFDMLVGRGLWSAAGHALDDPLERIIFLGDNLGAYDVKEEGPKDAKTDDGKPKSIPAIPLGGMQPAKPVKAKQAGEKQAGAKQEGVPAIPMIPMGGMTAAKPAKRPETPEEVARDVRQRLTGQLRQTAARRYGALLAAGRTAEAEALALKTLQYADDDAARAALVSCAIRAGQFDAKRDLHLEWLLEVSGGAGQ